MANKKKLFIYLGLFFLLVLLSWLVTALGRPRAGNINPLRNIDRKEWARFVLKNTSGEMEFENRNQKWVMTKPAVDNVSAPVFERMLTAMASFYASSAISENPKNFEKFGVDGSSVISIQVYLRDAGKPVLDGVIGQSRDDFSTSYIRFAGKDAVYLAADLPLYPFRFSPDDFRDPVLVPVRVSEANGFVFEWEMSKVDLYYSSKTWINRQTGQPVPPTKMDELASLLTSLRKFRFATDEEVKTVFAMAAETVLKITVDSGAGLTTAFVTNHIIDGDAKGVRLQMARAEGRQGVLWILQSDVLALKDFLDDFSQSTP